MTDPIDLIAPRTALGHELRDGLARVLDVLFPGTARLPSGRDVGAHLEWLDRVLDANPRPFEAVRELATKAASSDPCTLRDIEELAGAHLEDLIFTFNAAYYMSPSVLSALAYPGQARRPVAQATPEELCSDELIAPVRERGAIYVPTPARDDNPPPRTTRRAPSG